MGRSSEGSGVTHEKCTLDATNEARRATGRAPRARSGNRCGRARQACGKGLKALYSVNDFVSLTQHYGLPSRLQGFCLLVRPTKYAKKDKLATPTRHGTNVTDK